MRSFETKQYILPEDTRVNMPTLSYAYGAAQLAARYCGFDEVPYIPRGQWQHGWVGSQGMIDPVYVIWDDGRSDIDEYHWVSRKELEVFLHKHGYKNAQAIGVGIVYQPDIEIPRLPNSLLVMPGHSLYTTEHDWDFEEYMNYIEKIRHDFDYVTACIHPACLEKGYWVEAFRKAEIEIVPGALFAGNIALTRMHWLMSRFEYVTTNLIGTHVAYATRAGAKLSVCGKYIQTKKEDWKNVELFNRRPHLLDQYLELNKVENMYPRYSFLFHEHPHEAKQHIEWGRAQLGEDCKRSPAELRDLLMWPRKRSCLSFANLPEIDTTPTESKTYLPLTNLKQPDKVKQSIPFFQLQEKAENEDAEACYALALTFASGLHANYQDDEEACYWASRAAKLGHTEAIFFYACALTTGKGIEQDTAQAKALLERLPENYSQDTGAIISALESLPCA